MKNTTLGRKASNTMEKGAGEYRPRKTAAQSGDGADFAFNGQMGDGVNRDGHYLGRHGGNAMGLKARENYGAGPRDAKDNSQKSMHDHGPSVTRDKYREAPKTAKEAGVLGRTEVKRPPNPDAIYVE